MLKRNCPCLLALILLILLPALSHAQDWKGIKIPVSPGDQKIWQLQPVSDDFNYNGPPTAKPPQFHQRWKDGYINPWRGPGKTEFNSGHSYIHNGNLGIAANRVEGTDRISAGIVTSKETFTFPLYIEARVKISGLVMASNVWMLSKDSTQEIDVVEAYGGNRKGEDWLAERLHLSHHVFIRHPFQDYQPTDDGTWYFKDSTIWRHDFHRVGVYWRDPFHLEYYVDGKKVRTTSGKEMIDPKDFTGGSGLNKPMHIIINAEDQDWRTDQNITPTDEELADLNNSIMWVDWIRVYKLTDQM